VSGSKGGGRATTAQTDPRSPDSHLRGRTYAIFFDEVWRAACGVAGGGMRGWAVLRSDDEAGVIEAVATSGLRKVADQVDISVGLDENGQTRVDMTVTTDQPLFAAGRGRRLVRRFFGRLDARMKATPAQILDTSRQPSWSE
jgi:hypothetical protein